MTTPTTDTEIGRGQPFLDILQQNMLDFLGYRANPTGRITLVQQTQGSGQAVTDSSTFVSPTGSVSAVPCAPSLLSPYTQAAYCAPWMFAPGTDLTTVQGNRQGSCSAIDGYAYKPLIPYATTAMTDTSFGLWHPGMPGNGHDGVTYQTGNSSYYLLGQNVKTPPRLPGPSSVEAGLGITSQAYGTYPIVKNPSTNTFLGPAGLPNSPSGTVVPAAGTPDKIVSRPLLSVNADMTTVGFDANGHVTARIPAGLVSIGPGNAWGLQSIGGPTAAPSGTALSGTTLGVGVYQGWYTVVMDAAGNESPPSPAGSVTTTAGSQAISWTLPAVDLTVFPNATGRKLYRTSANGAKGGFVATVSGTSSTTYSDTTADASLGVPPPQGYKRGNVLGDNTSFGAESGTGKSVLGVNWGGQTSAPTTIPAPSTVLSGSLASGTALGIGVYSWAYSVKFPDGSETKPSAIISLTTTAGNQAGSITVPAVNVASGTYAGASTLCLYRTAVGGTGLYYVQDVAAAGATVTDTKADSALGRLAQATDLKVLSASAPCPLFLKCTPGPGSPGYSTGGGSTYGNYGVLNIGPSAWDGSAHSFSGVPGASGYTYNTVPGQLSIYFDKNTDINSQGIAIVQNAPLRWNGDPRLAPLTIQPAGTNATCDPPYGWGMQLHGGAGFDGPISTNVWPGAGADGVSGSTVWKNNLGGPTSFGGSHLQPSTGGPIVFTVDADKYIYMDFSGAHAVNVPGMYFDNSGTSPAVTASAPLSTSSVTTGSGGSGGNLTTNGTATVQNSGSGNSLTVTSGTGGTANTNATISSTGTTTLQQTGGTGGTLVVNQSSGTGNLATFQSGGTTVVNVLSSGLVNASSGGLATKVVAHTPSDADWSAAPPDGTMALDSANDHLFGRIGGSWFDLSGGGSGGTVTSVGLSAPSIFTVSGSPVTTSGTLGLALATQSANTVFAGPSSGAAAAPTFRALGSADLASGTASTGYVPTVQSNGSVAWAAQSGGGSSTWGVLTDGNSNIIFAAGDVVMTQGKA